VVWVTSHPDSERAVSHLSILAGESLVMVRTTCSYSENYLMFRYNIEKLTCGSSVAGHHGWEILH
jgi:hypothetical protein